MNGLKVKLLLCLVLTRCVTRSQPHSPATPTYTKVEVSFTMPYMVNPYVVDTMPVISRIVYAGAYTLYELPRRESSVIDSTALYDSLIYSYYVCKNGSKAGHVFTSFADTVPAPVNVDSAVKSAGLKPLNIPSELKPEGYSRKFLQTDGNTVHVYYTGSKGGSIDSIFFYYNNAYREVLFSFAPAFDSAFNSKMYRVEFLAQKNAGVNADYVNRFRKVIYEMKPLPVTNKKELDVFFDWYKKFTAAGGGG